MQSALPLTERSLPPTRVLLSGGSGLVGRAVLDRLLATGESFEVVAPSRRPLPQSSRRLRNPLFDPAKRVRESDAEFRRLLGEAPPEVWICALGTTRAAAGHAAGFAAIDRDLVLRFAALARRTGARQAILVSSVGAHPNAGSFYLRVKAEAERGLAELNFPRVDLLRPSLLLGQRRESRRLEQLAQRLAPLVNPVLLGPLRRYRAIPAEFVAAASVALARSGGSGWYVHEYDALCRLAAGEISPAAT